MRRMINAACAVTLLLSAGGLAQAQTGSAGKVYATPEGSAGQLGIRTLTGTYLPLPTVSSKGAVFSKGASASQWLRSLGTDGVFTASQPAFSDISGTISPTQITSLPSSLFANPSSSIGLTAVNGSATTVMRSDAAPALSQSISPTWTSVHKWSSGGANPLILPSQWGGNAITSQVAAGGVFNTTACATCTAIQQVSAWLSQSGTEHAYALFGQVQGNNGSAGNGVWAANLVAYSNNGGYSHGLEIDFGIGDTDGTSNPLTGYSYGIAINVAGVSGSNLVRGLQFSSIDPVNAKFSDAMVFLQYGAANFYNGALIKTEGTPTPTYGIDFRDATFTTSAFASTGFSVSPVGYVTSGRYDITVGAAAGAGSITSDSARGLRYVANASPSVYTHSFEDSAGTGIGGWNNAANPAWIPNTNDTNNLGNSTNRWANTYSVLGNFSGQITSSVATGTAPFSVASTTNVANLNASSLNGATFAAPGTIGGTTPAVGNFTRVTGTVTAAFGTAATFTSTEDSATFGPVVLIRHTRTTPAANDGLGWIGFNGNNSSSADKQYGVLSAVITSPTAGAEYGAFRLAAMTNGTTTTQMELGNGIIIGAPTGGAKGDGTLSVSGGYYANGTAGVSTTCTVTAGNSLVFTFGLLTTKGANCT